MDASAGKRENGNSLTGIDYTTRASMAPFLANKHFRDALAHARQSQAGKRSLDVTRASGESEADFQVRQVAVVRDACFEVLGLMDQLVRTPRAEQGDAEVAQDQFQAAASTNDLNTFYRDRVKGGAARRTARAREVAEAAAKKAGKSAPPKPLTEQIADAQTKLAGIKDPAQRSALTKQMAVLKQRYHREHRDGLVRRIGALLAIPEVGAAFDQVLREELTRFDAAQPVLSEMAKMREIDVYAREATFKTYIDSIRRNKTLTASAQAEIAGVNEMRQQANMREQGLLDAADAPTRGFLVMQRLLEARRGLKRYGYAMTPSRAVLIERVIRELAVGKKPFLVGSTGTGKTELAKFAFQLTAGGYNVVSWHEGTTPADLFGRRTIGLDPTTGQSVVQMEDGPVTLSIKEGTGMIHDEITLGATRTMMGTKETMNSAKPGRRVQIPGYPGQKFLVREGFGEIYTGNLADDSTKDREDLDPAMLRMWTGIDVDYMPSHELLQIILAMVIDDNGILRLTPDEVKLVQCLTQAAAAMHQIHNHNTETLKKLPYIKDVLKLCELPHGNDAEIESSIRDLSLAKNFLDPGTLFTLFAGWELSRTQGQTLAQHLSGALQNFLADPKNKNHPEEKQISLLVLQKAGVVSTKSTLGAVQVDEPAAPKNGKNFILPSEMAFIDTLK